MAISLSELEAERLQVAALLDKARKLLDAGEESKFEKLMEVLRTPNYVDEKLIVFTEHRDTAEFLVRRLEGLGFTDQVALIHGGLPYQEREQQVEFFRQPSSEGGANYLVATDAAGEGINLQFCWLMVNYDIPWNPARLEQRMGRIHRYGQTHDPVVIVNLVVGRHARGAGAEDAARQTGGHPPAAAIRQGVRRGGSFVRGRCPSRIIWNRRLRGMPKPLLSSCRAN